MPAPVRKSQLDGKEACVISDRIFAKKEESTEPSVSEFPLKRLTSDPQLCTHLPDVCRVSAGASNTELACAAPAPACRADAETVCALQKAACPVKHAVVNRQLCAILTMTNQQRR